MIQLHPDEYRALRDIISAGSDGLVLTGRDVRLSTAIRLEMAGHVTIQNGQRIRVTATSQGRAFQWRTAA